MYNHYKMYLDLKINIDKIELKYSRLEFKLDDYTFFKLTHVLTALPQTLELIGLRNREYYSNDYEWLFEVTITDITRWSLFIKKAECAYKMERYDIVILDMEDPQGLVVSFLCNSKYWIKKFQKGDISDTIIKCDFIPYVYALRRYNKDSFDRRICFSLQNMRYCGTLTINALISRCFTPADL